MPNRNDCWGIEVGANAIKAVRLVRKKKGEILVADYEIIPFKKILTTPDINVDEAIQVNLDHFLSQHSIAKSTVMISVPGHMAFARNSRLPPVDPKKIPDIARFEAVQQIPYPLEQVEWDYQIFSRAESPDVEVVIVAITKERIAQYLNNYFAVGMSVDGLTPSPLAVYNALAYDMEFTPETPGTILVDIGTSATDLIVVDNGQVWLRRLPIGGNNFTEALVRAFKLSFPKAERLKREAGTSKYARQIFQAMRPVFADLVQEMQRSLGYYQSVYRDAKLTRLIGVGSTFRLPGMQKFLKQQLQIEVIRPAGFKRVKIDGKEESAFAESAMNLATAYGLALQGLELEKVNVNLLPNNLIRQRVWREKSVWFAAAAGLMVGAVGIAGAKLWLDSSAYYRGHDEHAVDIKSVEDAANKLKQDWTKVSSASDPRRQIDNIRGILDYRGVWPQIIEDVNLAVKSLDPQSELDDSDYAKIKSIPRTERRRVYIQSIVPLYYFNKVADPVPVATPGTPGTSGTPAAAAKPAVVALKPLSNWGYSPSPNFVIRVTGTTPYAKGNILIGENLIQWLQANAVRKNRPYRLVVDPAHVTCDQLNADASSLTGSSTPDFSSPTTPGAPGAAPANAPATPEKTIGPDFLPLRPLENESKAGDWTFEVTWTVQLYTPDDARKIDAASAPAVAQGAQPADAPPVARAPTGAAPLAIASPLSDALPKPVPSSHGTGAAMKMVKAILRWLKVNLIIVISLVLCMASMGGLYYIQGAGQDFITKVNTRANESGTFDTLTNTDIELPPAELDQPSQRKRITVNQKSIDDIKAYYSKLSTEEEHIHDYVIGINEQNHPPFMPQLFPEPSDQEHTAQALDARVRYLKALEEMFEPYSAADYPQLHAKPGLDPLVIRDGLNREEEDFLAAKGKTSESTLTPDEAEKLQEDKANTLRNMLIDHAKSTHLYAETDYRKNGFPFTVAAWTAPGKARPTDSDLWEGQMTLWILGDIARVIALTNHVDNPDTNVILAPIKQLVRAYVVEGYAGSTPTGTGVSDNSAYAPQFNISPTGRTSRPLYDVRYVDLDMVVDWKLLPAFFDTLSQVNFMTVVKINSITNVDAYDALKRGLVLGSGDPVEVDMLIETIWFRDKWLTRLMPKEVQKARGIMPGGFPASSAALSTTVAGPSDQPGSAQAGGFPRR